MQIVNLTDIRDTVESAISLFLSTEQPRVRDIMQRAIILELRRNKISRLWCSGFKVYLREGRLGFDTANISLDEKCPQCGTSYLDSKLLYLYHADTDQEEHIYGCKCGCVYKIMW